MINLLKIGLTNSNNQKRIELVYDYAQKKILNEKLYDKDLLLKYTHSNGYTKYSSKNQNPLVKVFRDFKQTIISRFNENNGKLTRFLKNDKDKQLLNAATFDESGNLRKLVQINSKNKTKTTYTLNDFGDVVNITGHKAFKEHLKNIEYNQKSGNFEFNTLIEDYYGVPRSVITINKRYLNSEDNLFREYYSYHGEDSDYIILYRNINGTPKIAEELAFYTNNNSVRNKDSDVYIYLADDVPNKTKWSVMGSGDEYNQNNHQIIDIAKSIPSKDYFHELTSKNFFV